MNITLLLVLSALFISVLDSMPRTSYVKMSDIWLIFCLLVPLAEVLFHAVLDKYRYDVENEDEEVMALAKLHPKLAWAPKAKMDRKKKCRQMPCPANTKYWYQGNWRHLTYDD